MTKLKRVPAPSSFSDLIDYVKAHELDARVESGIAAVTYDVSDPLFDDKFTRDQVGIINYWLTFFNQNGWNVKLDDFLDYCGFDPRILLKTVNNSSLFYQQLKVTGDGVKTVLFPTAIYTELVDSMTTGKFNAISGELRVKRLFDRRLKAATKLRIAKQGIDALSILTDAREFRAGRVSTIDDARRLAVTLARKASAKKTRLFYVKEAGINLLDFKTFEKEFCDVGRRESFYAIGCLFKEFLEN